MTGPPPSLTEDTLAQGLRHLFETDRDLAQVIFTRGAPPLWSRQPGFPTLVHIILEQQVSLASAQAAFERLLQAIGPITPQRFLELDDAQLNKIGFSRQKITYTRGLADLIVQGNFDLSELASLDDTQARRALLEIKGIGPWTADIYLLMALGRPDIWPAGDLALAIAVQGIKRLPDRPTQEQLDEIGQAWRPWRAVAARICWHYYLT